MRKFKLLDLKNESDVLGGEVDRDNAALLTISSSTKPIDDLVVGETAVVHCMGSGTQGDYQIVRVQ